MNELGEREPKRAVDDRFGITEAVADAQDHLRDGLPTQLRHIARLLNRLVPRPHRRPGTSQRNEATQVAAHDLCLILQGEVLERGILLCSY